MKKKTRLELEEIHEVLKRHRGSFRDIAEKLHVRSGSVANALKDRSGSRRIRDAAHSMALDLLAKEQREQVSA